VEAVREALLTHETIDAIIVVDLLPDVGNAQNCLSGTSPTGWAATSAIQLAVVQWRPERHH
jgi:hypothetical protein